MHRLRVANIPLPEIYVCDKMGDDIILADAGIPYIKTTMSDIDIVKVILYRVLKDKFPHIKWDKVLGCTATRRLNVFVPGCKVDPDQDTDKPDSSGEFDSLDEPEIKDSLDQDDTSTIEKGSNVHSQSLIASEYREFTGTGGIENIKVAPIDEFCFDEASHVNIETLQSLGFLPKFMDDAADAIRINLMNRAQWHEGWNKRLGAAVGDIGYSYDAANLIILDISGSIPEGISATMLRLIDTLRSQTNAEVIITGTTSMYWGDGEDLPTPEWIRSHIGYMNEASEFFKILKKHVAGRHFGNVISFGDNDCPYYRFDRRDTPERNPLVGVKVDRVLHYHTTYPKETGYARWVSIFSPDAEQVFDTSWCEVMIK